MTQEQINSINSYLSAKTLWTEEFGEPEFFAQADIPDVVEELYTLESELKSLEVEISRRDNISHYKLNRTISLHFVIKSGNEYLDTINELVYEGVYEAELEQSDVLTGATRRPWELI